MTPYYEQDGITIYHGDCREVLPRLTGGAVVTDPPYGLPGEWSGGTWARQPIYQDAKSWDEVVPELPNLLFGRSAIVWGGHLYDLPPSRCCLAWMKPNKLQTMADFELAWTTLDRPSKAWTAPRDSRGSRFHACEKPVELMIWCLEFVDGPVVDPFMGSGSTLVAAKRLGRRAIGIEIEERYCEVAVRRLAQSVIDMTPPTEESTQMVMDV